MCIVCCLEKEMLGLFQEKKGNGVVGLCCEAAADLACAQAERKVLCQALGQVFPLPAQGTCS